MLRGRMLKKRWQAGVAGTAGAAGACAISLTEPSRARAFGTWLMLQDTSPVASLTNGSTICQAFPLPAGAPCVGVAHGDVSYAGAPCAGVARGDVSYAGAPCA